LPRGTRANLVLNDELVDEWASDDSWSTKIEDTTKTKQAKSFM
jgi:hypothetical protein